MKAAAHLIQTFGKPAIAAFAFALASGNAMADPLSVVYDFTDRADGANPEANVVLDKLGNFYGTTTYGGNTSVYPLGTGTIFKSDPNGNVTTLHDFDPIDGYDSESSLTLDADTLFGTTEGGGANYDGVVFSIKTNGSAYTVLHDFTGLDGYFPDAQLAKLPNAGLAGVTIYGGPEFNYDAGNKGRGVLFALARNGRFQVLHNFEVGSGDFPQTVLTNSAGTIFGSTAYGGNCTTTKGGCGVVFRYDLPTHTYTVLHDFTGGTDGVQPLLGSIGPDGSLYGTAVIYPNPATTGTLFKLTPSAGSYTMSILANFTHTTGFPFGGTLLLHNGSLIGYSTKWLYIYQDGKISVLHEFGPNSAVSAPLGPPVIGPNGIVGAAAGGGVSPCISTTGMYISDSCGTLFTYAPTH